MSDDSDDTGFPVLGDDEDDQPAGGKKKKRSRKQPVDRSKTDIPAAVAKLRIFQRWRSIGLKSKLMQTNRLVALVAGSLGYANKMSKKERMQKFKEATALILAVERGEQDAALKVIIKSHLPGIRLIESQIAGFEVLMEELADTLPVAEWVKLPAQSGFGMLSLAIVVGETGDLSTYTNPGKVWRRLCCAPWSYNGKTLMGSSWRMKKEGVLPDEEWEHYGYSPRKSSIRFLIGDRLVKNNKPREARVTVTGINRKPKAGGPYFDRYLNAKRRAFETHPEWWWKACPLCNPGKGVASEEDEDLLDEGSLLESGLEQAAQTVIPDDLSDDDPEATPPAGKKGKGKGKGKVRVRAKKAAATKVYKRPEKVHANPDCLRCGGTGHVCMRAHRHGMLLAVKLLLKNLWLEWNGNPELPPGREW